MGWRSVRFSFPALGVKTRTGVLAMKTWAAAAVLSVGAVSAQGAIIGFNQLTGGNGTPMPSPYFESGFAVTPQTAWLQAQIFGAPVPAIYSGADLGIIEVTLPVSNLFTFNSVDLADANAAAVAGYLIEGFLQNAPVFSIQGGPLPDVFVTVANPNSGAVIDLLRITMIRNGTTTYNIDNINVQDVPAPPVGAALVGSLLACVARRRR
jgi:hypothetical protein